MRDEYLRSVLFGEIDRRLQGALRGAGEVGGMQNPADGFHGLPPGAASAMDQPLTKAISCLRQAHCAAAASLVRSALGEAHSSFNSLLGRFRAGARRRDRLMEGRVGQNRRSGEEGGTARGLRRLGERPPRDSRSEEHTSELQSRFGISYAVFCLKK